MKLRMSWRRRNTIFSPHSNIDFTLLNSASVRAMNNKYIKITKAKDGKLGYGT
jgi:hypothetical protein